MIDSKSLKDGETPFTQDSEDAGADRVQKLIAQAGVASRRDAEDFIRDGLVTINGKTAKLGDKATLGIDAIKVKGKLIHYAQNKVYYMIYKPKNVIAMIAEDEEGRETLKDFTHKLIKERIFTIGRMDFKGEGAILLTNDGEMAQKILKSNDIIRRYHVKVDRHPTQEELARLARGGRIEGRSMTPHHVRVAEGYSRNALIEISFEGMGAIDVKKYFENKGFFPEKVARVGIGHLNAEKLPPGSFRKLNPSSVEALFMQPELAKRQIERLVDKRAAGVKMVDDEIMAQDAERRRHSKPSPFMTKEKKAPAVTSFLRPDQDKPEVEEKAPRVRISASMHARGAKANTDRVKRMKAAATHSGPNSRSKTINARASARPARDGDAGRRSGDRFTGGRTSERPAVRGFGDRPMAAPYQRERPVREAPPARGTSRPARGGARPAAGARSATGARPSFGDKPSRVSDRPARAAAKPFGEAGRRASTNPAARKSAGAGKIRFKRA
jgi:23S rRNA pseudouridine2605 synthase